MILDALHHAPRYFPLAPRIHQALEHLQAADYAGIPAGRYEIDGSRLFALVSEYETIALEQGLWEAHRQYIDVQYVQAGEERIRYAHLGTLVAGPYDSEKDLLRAEGGPGELFLLRPDRFAIFFPHDAHSPGLVTVSSGHVRKVVLKVAVED